MSKLFLLFLQLSISLKVSHIPETRTPPPSVKGLCLCLNSSNHLFTFGGHEKSDKLHNSVNFFDLSSKTWIESIPIKALTPEARYNAGCFTYKESLYIFGGNTNNGPVNDLWSYNMLTLSWKELESSSSPSFRYLFGFCSFEYKGRNLFAIYGGWKDEGLSSGFYLLDVDELKWQKLENGPLALAGLALFYLNQSIFVIGGVLAEEEMNEKVLKYDLESEKWTEVLCENWKPRSKFSVGVLNDSVYVMFGWKDSTSEYESSILKFDLEKCRFDLLQVKISSESLVQNYGSAFDDHSIYLFGGVTEKGVTNLLQTFSSGSLKTITEKSTSPKNLMNASLTQICTFLYLFGGMYKETRYNELWRFDLLTLKWQKLRSYGDIPSPRSHHAATSEGDVLIIFGGKDANQYFNDGFQMNALTLIWEVLVYAEINPSARFSPCIVARLPLIYMYGGETMNGFSDSLYQYNISDGTYKKISESYGFTLGSGQICFLNDFGDLFTVLFGSSDADEPLGYVQSFNFTDKVWRTLYQPDRDRFSRARPIIVDVGERFYITGGSYWATTPKKDVFLLDLKTKSIKELGKIDEVAYQAPSARFKSKVYIYGGGSSYNELIRYSIATHNFISFDLEDLCTNDCNQICSQGSYFNSSLKTCETCSAGYYSNTKGSSFCKACESGTYNDKSGATSERQCYPCHEGTYSSKQGSSLCIDCQAGFYCPIGSSKPLVRLEEVEISSSQPGPYQRKTQEAGNLTSSIRTAFIIFAFFSLAFILPFSRFRRFLIKFDKFDDLHNYEDEVPLVTRKTLIGGIFSVIYFSLAAFIIAASFIVFFLDNVVESKTLVPFVVLDEITKVSGNVWVEVRLGNYGGDCVLDEENSEGLCSKSIFYSLTEYFKEDISFKCAKSQNECLLSLFLKDFQVQAQSVLILSLLEQGSYTSRISVKVSSESSIPDLKSEVVMVAYPKKNHVFRGQTPTLFEFSFIPSYFTSDEDGSEMTGYHISPSADPSGGTSYNPTNLGFSADLKIRIVIRRSINGLRTERTLIYTFSLLILTLIGSIPGIKDILGSIMSYIEEKFLSFKESREKEKLIQFLRERRRDGFHFSKDTGLAVETLDATVAYNSKSKPCKNFLEIDSLGN